MFVVSILVILLISTVQSTCYFDYNPFCNITNPCDLNTCIEKGRDGDELLLQGDEYVDLGVQNITYNLSIVGVGSYPIFRGNTYFHFYSEFAMKNVIIDSSFNNAFLTSYGKDNNVAIENFILEEVNNPGFVLLVAKDLNRLRLKNSTFSLGVGGTNSLISVDNVDSFTVKDISYIGSEALISEPNSVKSEFQPRVHVTNYIREVVIENSFFKNLLGGIFRFVVDSTESYIQVLQSSFLSNENYLDTDGPSMNERGCVFFVTANVLSSVDIVVQSSNFTDNLCFDSGGTALNIEYANNVDISDSMFIGNRAPSSSNGYGGSVYIYGGAEVSIFGTLFQENEAGGDGGSTFFENSDSVNLHNAKFVGNTASMKGGGTASNGIRNTSVIQCSFKNNQANNWPGGGGMYFISFEFTHISHSLFSDNAANMGYGGGAYFEDSQHDLGLEIASTVFDNNFAWSGGGVYTVDVHVIKVENDTFSRNLGSGDFSEGGGLNVHPGVVSFTAVGCFFDENEAAYGGGMNYWDLYMGQMGDFTFSNCIFSSNVASGAYGLGAGVCMDGFDEAYFDSCIFVGNEAGKHDDETGLGGGLLTFNGDGVTVTNSQFLDNIAHSWSGGFELQAVKNLSFSHTLFQNNSARFYIGGLSQIDSETVSVDNCTFINNMVSEDSDSTYGGGLSLTSFSVSAAVSNSHFENNYASVGAGLYAGYRDFEVEFGYSGSLEVTNCVFVENSCDVLGGALSIQGVETSSIKNSVFENNFASVGGAGVYGKDTELSISNSWFQDNRAGMFGGGVCVSDVYGFYIDQSNFVRNSAREEDSARESDTNQTAGGGLMVTNVNGTVMIVNCEFVGNEAIGNFGNAGGVRVENVKNQLIVKNNDFSLNRASECGGGMGIKNVSSNISIIDNTFQDNDAIEGAGIDLMNVVHVVVENSSFLRNNIGSGFQMDGFESVIVDDCNFNETGGIGLYLESGGGAEISGTLFSENQGVGLGTDKVSELVIFASEFLNNVGGGAVVVSSDHSHFENVQMTGISGDGALLLDQQEGITILMEQSSFDGGGGVYLNEFENITVRDSVFSGIQQASIASVYQLVIEDNQISSTNFSIDSSSSSDVSFLGNMIVGSGSGVEMTAHSSSNSSFLFERNFVSIFSEDEEEEEENSFFLTIQLLDDRDNIVDQNDSFSSDFVIENNVFDYDDDRMVLLAFLKNYSEDVEGGEVKIQNNFFSIRNNGEDGRNEVVRFTYNDDEEEEDVMFSKFYFLNNLFFGTPENNNSYEIVSFHHNNGNVSSRLCGSDCVIGWNYYHYDDPLILGNEEYITQDFNIYGDYYNHDIVDTTCIENRELADLNPDCYIPQTQSCGRVYENISPTYDYFGFVRNEESDSCNDEFMTIGPFAVLSNCDITNCSYPLIDHDFDDDDDDSSDDGDDGGLTTGVLLGIILGSTISALLCVLICFCCFILFVVGFCVPCVQILVLVKGFTDAYEGYEGEGKEEELREIIKDEKVPGNRYD